MPILTISDYIVVLKNLEQNLIASNLKPSKYNIQ